MQTKHLTTLQLEAGLPKILKTPKNKGTLKMIVARPAENERVVLTEGEISLTRGLVGDMWHIRPSSRTVDGSPHPDKQLNIMNARAIALIAQTEDRWQLAGDQLYIDFDISEDNLPAGSRLAIGEAIIEVTPLPHNGCKKFTQRFGIDAVKFVNSPIGKQLHLRGINAKVIQPGTIRVGDTVQKISINIKM